MSYLEENFEKLFYTKILQLHSTTESLNHKEINECQQKTINEHIGRLLSRIIGLVPDSDGSTPGRKKVEVSKSSEVEFYVNGMSKYFLRNAETILNGYQQYLIEPLKARNRITFENVMKPQLLFKDKIDNRSNSVFAPRITRKYNSPTNSYFQSNSKPGAASEHPYSHEIEAVTLPLGFESVIEELGGLNLSLKSLENITEVNSLEGLKGMIKELREQKVFSFDLHNHSFRSFMGFVCYLEISTQNKNFLIDALLLREHLEDLNEVFTNPRVVKIGYDTKDKVLWLQRDFGLYIVGLIDLDLLLKALKVPSSLTFLASSFLDLNIRSIYIEFDFRKRPLSNKEKSYLQSFSWAILGIFARSCSFQNILEFVKTAFVNSKHAALKLFSKDLYAPEELQAKFMDEIKDDLKSNEFSKLTKLLAWRDESARMQDESYEYILPNSLIRAILINPARDIDSLRLVCQQHSLEISSEHAESIFAIIQEKPYLSEKNFQDKQESSDRGAELISSLFTPSRESVFKSIQASENESPAYDQTELHKLIDWNSEHKAGGKGADYVTTPVRKYDDIIQRTVLTPSIFKDSPSEDNRDDIHHLLNILNGRNDPELVRSEISKFVLFATKKSELIAVSAATDTEDNLTEIIPYVNVREEIPGTIEEIYEIGNNIRKKNKAKKKKESKPKDQENMTPNQGLKFQSPNVKEDADLKFLFGEKPQNASKAGQSNDQILYELGWLQ